MPHLDGYHHAITAVASAVSAEFCLRFHGRCAEDRARYAFPVVATGLWPVSVRFTSRDRPQGGGYRTQAPKEMSTSRAVWTSSPLGGTSFRRLTASAIGTCRTW